VTTIQRSARSRTEGHASDLGPFDQRLKAYAHKPRLLAIAAGAFPPPVSVKIELTNVCNHDCHFCAYRRIVQTAKPAGMLDEARVLELVDELAEGGVSGLMFTGGGEPLVHPGCDRIFERCRERGIEHALITNGTLLSRISDAGLAGLRWIRFSINAGSSEEYARVHGSSASDWDRVWRNVARAANRERFPALAVGVSFVATAENKDSVRALVARAREHGADYAHVRPAFEGPHTELGRQLDDRERRAIKSELDALEELEGATFRVYGVKRRFDEIASRDRKHVHCRSTPLVSYVLPSGDVTICTLVRDASFNPAVRDPFVGNIREARFFDLWGSEKHRRLVASLSRSGCSRCHFAEYNRALEEMTHDVHHSSFL
jgi:MoaA/NifB/PqqE/SkfB family radical SAM enzyme